jgi:N-acetyl-1-D-myo-inositol-2-amino-2-deoxy-alpha-D-glucopyranoside deacetylase
VTTGVTTQLPAGAFAGQTLLAVFAHPDDESITCGGLLAACAALGARVALLCLTRGEAGPSAAPTSTVATGAAGTTGPAVPLGTQRADELRDAARTLGIADVTLLDHPDGMLPWTDAAAIETDIRAVVARLRPDVVVTFGADGLYWHPDHIAVHERVTSAVQSMGNAAPALYFATMPPGAVRAVFNRATARAAQAGAAPPRQILGITEPDAFGAHAAEPTLVVDVRAFTVAKLAALRSHASQLADDALAWLTADDATLLGIEHFHRAGTREGFIERLGR